MAILQSVYDLLRGKKPEAGSPPFDPAQVPGSVEQKPPIDEGELISYVNTEYDRRRKERIPFENQWKVNINFIESNQFIDINPVTQAIEEIPKIFDWQEREVFNMIAPNIETRLAREGRMRPVYKVRPGSNDPDDIRSTKVGDHLLKNMYYDTKMKAKQADANTWMEATGTAIMKHVWNPKLGRLVGYDDTVVDMQRQPIPQEIREGDVDSSICPPQEIFPDSSYHQEVVDCQSIIHAKAFHIDEIEEMYGKRVQPEQVSVMQLQRSMTGIGGLGYNSLTHNYTTMAMKDYALVKEYWEMPSKKHPEGRLIIVCNGILLYYLDRLPYMVGEDGKPALPFTKCVCIKRTGCFWGKSVTERLIPVQRRYNAVRNRKAEFLNRIGIGQWTVEEGTTDIQYMEENAGSPGAIMEHTRGANPPKPVIWGSLPAEFETEINLLLQEFSILSGVSELSRQSAAPSGVKSGVALQLALEQDDTRLSTTVDNIADFGVENGKMWLRLYKQYAKGPRVLRSIGKNNVVEVIDWSASDINSDDVMIETYSASAESPAQRRQMVFDLVESGMMDDNRFSKEAKNKIMEMLELGNWESLDDEDELHVAKAERENLSLKQGQMDFPDDFDDHVLHVLRHNKFRLTVEFEELVKQNPIIAQMFADHIQYHALSLQEQVMREQATMAAMQPQPEVA